MVVKKKRNLVIFPIQGYIKAGQLCSGSGTLPASNIMKPKLKSLFISRLVLMFRPEVLKISCMDI
jgi:hypothetical protein